MRAFSYEDYLADPSAVVEQVVREARRERAAAMARLVTELFR